MDYKKSKAGTNTVTRNISSFNEKNANIYETLVVIAKRSNIIGLEMKEELNNKLAEFATTNDNLEEVFENREQIEIAKYYEHLPKPTLIAIHEFLNDQIYFKNPDADSIKFSK
ncbi:MAG: RNA polymerase Rpb6 [Bacteroidetes bacterium]|nr:RNA polymerase Rpb6 [Bacteroidota bacterium]